MKNLLTFEDFVNESLNKSQFNKLDYDGMANAIIEEPSSLSFISGDKFAMVIKSLGETKKLDLLKRLVDSINLDDLKIFPLSEIATHLPGYAEKVLEVISKGRLKEKVDISSFFDLYRTISKPNEISKIIKFVPLTDLVNIVNNCPTLIKLISPEMCAKSAMTFGRSAYYHCLDFLTLPDEFVTIKEKQEFINSLSKNIKAQLKSYFEGELNLVSNAIFTGPFNNQYYISPLENKFFNKYKNNLKADTPEGLEFFKTWGSQLSF